MWGAVGAWGGSPCFRARSSEGVISVGVSRGPWGGAHPASEQDQVRGLLVWGSVGGLGGGLTLLQSKIK